MWQTKAVIPEFFFISLRQLLLLRRKNNTSASLFCLYRHKNSYHSNL